MPKLFIGFTVLLLAAIAILVTPWFPSTVSSPIAQTFTATLTGAFTNYQGVTVYSLPNPVEFPPGSWSFEQWDIFLSQNFTLQAGREYQLATTMECQPSCYLLVLRAISNSWTGPALFYEDGTAYLNNTGQASFVASVTGPYQVMMYHERIGSGTVNAVSITTIQAQTIEVLQTGYITAESTVYSEVALRPYIILGVLPSLMTLIIVGCLAVIIFLLDRTWKQSSSITKS